VQESSRLSVLDFAFPVVPSRSQAGGEAQIMVSHFPLRMSDRTVADACYQSDRWKHRCRREGTPACFAGL